MTRTIEMNNIIQERYQFCIWLNLIARERGVEHIINVDLFRDFLNTPQCTELATLEGHTYYMRCLTHHENKLFSGNYNNIRIWKGILIGRCVSAHENKLYSGSNDKTIRIWKI